VFDAPCRLRYPFVAAQARGEARMAKVLVTGGAGFIGSHSVDRLLALGHQVRVIDDFSSGHAENLQAHPMLEVQRGDIRDPEAVATAMDGCSRVLHLAAQVFVPESIARPLHSASINVSGFLNVIDCARRLGAEKLVYASSAAVYGSSQDLPLRESSQTGPESPYGLEKLIDDQYAGLFAQLYGQSLCGMRYFNVYGPRQDPRSPYSGVISKFLERAAAGQPLTVFGDGLQTRDFVSVFDVARANAAALFSPVCGIVNVATGHSVSLLELIDALSQALGRPLQVAMADPRAGEVRHSAVDPRRMRGELNLDNLLPLADGLRRLLT
jgi:UDP-glucose 4-epimerase